jgi:ribosomal protein S27E
MLAPSEHVACNLCGSDAADPTVAKHGFTIVRCRQCSLAYVTPRPDAAALVAM